MVHVSKEHFSIPDVSHFMASSEFSHWSVFKSCMSTLGCLGSCMKKWAGFLWFLVSQNEVLIYAEEHTLSECELFSYFLGEIDDLKCCV